MFAGVGCFSIIIANRVPTSKVYSIDINPDAVKLMEENIRLNRVFGKVIPVLGDSKLITETQLQRCTDRVLMPLPEKTLEFLPSAVSAVKSSGGWVHCHIFEHARSDEDPRRKALEEISVTLISAGINFAIPFSRIVRSIGPNWYHIATDIQIKS